MAFLTGHTVQSPNANKDTTALQNQLVNYLGGDLSKLFPGTQFDPAMIQPILDLFSQQNARTGAQAKESAGNLTGSGFANTLGARLGEATNAQNAYLAEFINRRQMDEANRRAGLILGSLNSNAGGVQTSYQPGFLDYAAQGLTGLASGGAFAKGGIFGGG